MGNNDITQTIISNEVIRERIGSIFPDSVILDSHFNFISVSQNILEATGYTRSDLKGKSVSMFSHGDDIQKLLEEKLRPGYFVEEQFEIRKKNEGTIRYSVSGFYLGLIADINGMIVLKFKNLDEINLMYDRLDAKTTEIDSFVYLSAHALRGPLATIKGLANLARSTKKQEELDYIVQKIDVFADQLDDKLHRLIYFAESDKGYEAPEQDLSLQSICEALMANIREASIDHPAHFACSTLDQSLVLENGKVILALLRNIVLFFCQQSKHPDNLLIFDLHSNASATEIIIRAKGFQLNAELTEKLSNINFGYSEILHYPELINCYAAKKIIFKLRGNIQFILTPSQEVVVLMTVPRRSFIGSIAPIS